MCLNERCPFATFELTVSKWTSPNCIKELEKRVGKLEENTGGKEGRGKERKEEEMEIERRVKELEGEWN